MISAEDRESRVRDKLAGLYMKANSILECVVREGFWGDTVLLINKVTEGANQILRENVLGRGISQRSGPETGSACHDPKYAWKPVWLEQNKQDKER